MSAGLSLLTAATPRPTRDTVVVHVAPLDGSAPRPGALIEEEWRQASRLRAGALEWAAARAFLRRLLGAQLAIRPEHVALAADSRSKPRLASRSEPDLRFSVSHSGGYVAVALRIGAEVGVDIERRRCLVDPAAVADACGLSLPPGEDFFRAWVRHEALAKASGRGITAPPRSEDAARFTVRELDGIPGFAAALASEGDAWSVRLAC